MTPEQALKELEELVSCRCHPAFKDRGLHDPNCNCDSKDAVEAVARYIKELEEDY